MAISDSEKLDFLWKRVIFGVGKTDSAANKGGSNETIPSALPVYSGAIWSDAAAIPGAPPSENASDSVVGVLTGAARIRMTSDPTSTPNAAWLATSTYGTLASRLTDFIDGTFGSGYAVKAYIGDPNGGPAARIFPDTTGEEWVFDYAAGVLLFTGSIPASRAATIGTGTVSVAGNGMYIEVYRYVGRKGSAASQEDLGTMAAQDADSIEVTGGNLTNVVLINVTVDGGEYP